MMVGLGATVWMIVVAVGLDGGCVLTGGAVGGGVVVCPLHAAVNRTNMLVSQSAM